MKVSHHITLLSVVCFIGIMQSTNIYAQETTTREERIKLLQLLQSKYDQEELSQIPSASKNTPANIEKLELPPLSVFLDAVSENATIKKKQAEIQQIEAEYRLQKRDWWDYLRLNAMYSYGRYNMLSNNSDEFTPMYQTTMSSAQHNFNVGASITVPLGGLVNRKLRNKSYKYSVDQIKYSMDEVMEERKLKVLEAYNAVTEQLATIKAKAESAALYNAQMKISENNFIQGSIDIISLSLERGRRSTAVVQYEQSRVALHNSIILLEMLTNVKIIKDK